ncbi:flagellar protein MotY [Salinivibrio sharmensis]|uniref:Flagellar protein MotY n=1 Tax=Salinivibrio sharmensis TaxID=390883 RepID=A0ABX3KJ18_9GAMM|nr:OmpA family protein [Salinivibrio sharmensis]OOE89652.1 flagellar protein MotY [Salinivibrio sharmensis]
MAFCPVDLIKWRFTPVVVLSCVGLLLPSQASANKQYVASLGKSSWTVTIDTPIECRLEHDVPGYGQASFTSRASKDMNLDFSLDMQRPMGETAQVSLLSMPADWMPGEPARYMDQLKFFKQFDGYVGGQTAWAMLSELEAGRFPTFSFKDWQRQQRQVDVALSAVAFGAPYNEFSQCLNKLLPYAFEDISFTVLRYQENSDELTKASRQRLTQIAEFVRYSDDIDLVLVATYSDARGTREANQQMSERRAKKLRDYFTSLGLPEDRITVEAYGERRPIADNDDPIGRSKNRRVVISLGRTLL